MQKVQCEDVQLKGIHVERSDNASAEINPRKISAMTIIGDKIKSRNGKELGKVEEVVLDLTCGTVSYVVLSIGGFAGIGDKFFAVPLDALTVDTKEKVLYLDVDKKTLKKAQGFDKQNWPEKAEWPYSKEAENKFSQ